MYEQGMGADGLPPQPVEFMRCCARWEALSQIEARRT